MFKKILLLLIAASGLVYAEGFTKSELVGIWEFLGISYERVNNSNEISDPLWLSRTRFRSDGFCEKNQILNKNSPAKNEICSWKLQNNILSITMPEGETENYEIISYKNNILQMHQTEGLKIYVHYKKM